MKVRCQNEVEVDLTAGKSNKVRGIFRRIFFLKNEVENVNYSGVCPTSHFSQNIVALTVTVLSF